MKIRDNAVMYIPLNPVYSMSSAYPMCHSLNKLNNHLLDQLIHVVFALSRFLCQALGAFSKSDYLVVVCPMYSKYGSLILLFLPHLSAMKKTHKTGMVDRHTDKETDTQTDRQLRILNKEDCPRKSPMKVLMSKFDRLYVWRLKVLSRSGAFDWGCAAECGGAGRLDN